MKSIIKFPLATLLRGLPDAVHTEMLAHLFNHALKGQWMREQLADLDGKRVAIDITDTKTILNFQIHGSQFRRATPEQRGQKPVPNVTIRGSLESFWLLASRTEDPDTLFFNRQLELEGETETGLYIKNMLDGLDFDPEAHLHAVLGKRIGNQVFKLIRQSGIDQRLRLKMGLPEL